ncbi:MAG TPA: hypothetical protein VFK41_01760 [Nocardioidaceae bacterium]|nr:hypothetical protein [Nocardioidaceae bacterium]
MDTKRIIQLLVGANLAAGAWSFIVDGVTPSWVVYPVLLMITIALLRRGGTTGSGYLAGIAALFTVMHLPFIREAVSSDCVHPADANLDCHPVTWMATLGIVPALTALVAAVVFVMARRHQRVPGNA